MDHARVARDVIKHVGGAGNITAAAHCATRLRLVLADLEQVDQKALDADPDLKGTFVAGGMYQIIVGPGDVDVVYRHMVTDGGVREVSKDAAKEEAEQGGNPFSRFVKMIADIFVPVLPALIAGGLMMAINNVLTADFFSDAAHVTAENPEGLYSLVDRWSWLTDYAALINMISAAAFSFLPILIGFSAAKRFGGNVYLGAAIGGAMVSGELLNAWSTGAALAGQAQVEYWHLFGMDVAKIGYQAQVIPTLAVTYVMCLIEKQLHKRLKGTVDFLLTPLVTMLVTGFLAFIAIGPVTRLLAEGLTNSISWGYDHLGALGGLLFGLVYSPIVVTGLHQSFPAVEIPLITSGVGDFIFPIASMANIAQGAVALAVFFKARDAKLKGLAGAGGASAVFGITEPAIFGVNLRLRWPFFIGMGAAALGSMGVALFNVRGQALGAAGFVGLVSIKPESIPMYLVLEALTFLVAFGVAFAYATTPRGRASLGAATEVAGASTEAAPVLPAEVPAAAASQPLAEATPEPRVLSPLAGQVLALEQVEDAVFASGALGPGLAVEPSGGEVVSPLDGEVVLAFPTGHAYGIRAANGLEVLVHVGLDTVRLEGRGFTPKVQQGDRVAAGQTLVEVDWEAVKAAGYQTVTPVVVTKGAQPGSLSPQAAGEVQRGQALFSVEAAAVEA
ncbi:PTS beta-glucoside transporter subunit IIBCA [Actinomyces weissii]|uniref:PTS transporter subunit EIIC n=1 Tax=Actinomyces weissii TaxID=675090 RepID=A0A7T7S1E4_9ACTO|nr:PTS beta-glucoside transporter subunit IIBCA [Actinomyces weissii]QQM66552.1 PTS transporter subunit EIIC [Actinomyces weissii]